MKTKRVELPLPHGKIDMHIDIYGWTKCYLRNYDREYYLGAGLIEEISKRITKGMQTVDAESAGEINGEEVRLVLSLGEVHHTLYFSKHDNDRTIFFQNALENTIHKETIDDERYSQWCEILDSETGGQSGKERSQDV